MTPPKYLRAHGMLTDGPGQSRTDGDGATFGPARSPVDLRVSDGAGHAGTVRGCCAITPLMGLWRLVGAGQTARRWATGSLVSAGYWPQVSARYAWICSRMAVCLPRSWPAISV
jgi:hypothetical protein